MLWRMAAELGVTYFGTSAPFLLQCRKEGIVPREIADLAALRGIGSTGAPLPAEGFRWVYDAVSSTALLGSLSGGTDVCSGFVGPAPTLPVYAGEITCRCLGAAVAAYDEHARPVVGSARRAGDREADALDAGRASGATTTARATGRRTSRTSPGCGATATGSRSPSDGTCIITGRSDATLNRGGVRLGTAEFYTVVEALARGARQPGGAPRGRRGRRGDAGAVRRSSPPALELDDDGRAGRSPTALRTRLSPRHVPDVVHQVSALPHTLSGKRIEVPAKKILRGVPTDEAVARGALTAPSALAELEEFRDRLA